jgi:hypothetical protein
MGRPALPREHGTPRGYQQHRYYRETPCDACSAIRRAGKQPQQYRQRNKGTCAPGLGWPLLPGDGAPNEGLKAIPEFSGDSKGESL